MYTHIFVYIYIQTRKTCTTIEKQANIRHCVIDLSNKYKKSVQPH